MEHTYMGCSGLRVGTLGIGTLTWGRDTESDDARAMVNALLDAGGCLVDVSPVYGEGLAEEVLGDILRDGVAREELVIVAHVGSFYRTDAGDTTFNGGRGALMASLDRTLETLGTSYVDVLEVAAPDVRVPIAETLGTLADCVSSGKARYIGLANHSGWRIARAQQYMIDHSLPWLTSIGTEYSVLARTPESEIVPVAREYDMGIITHASLAGGVLTGKYRHTIPATSRAATEHLSVTVDRYLTDRPRRIVEAVTKAADGLGRTPADVALSWLIRRDCVACALIGARTAAQCEQLLAADLSPLPEPITRALDEVSSTASRASS